MLPESMETAAPVIDHFGIRKKASTIVRRREKIRQYIGFFSWPSRMKKTSAEPMEAEIRLDSRNISRTG
jgi:hypothetical protein